MSTADCVRKCDTCPYYKTVEGYNFRSCSKWKCAQEGEGLFPSVRIVARWNLLDEANDIYGCTHCGKLMFGREKLRAICPNCKTPMEV